MSNCSLVSGNKQAQFVFRNRFSSHKREELGIARLPTRRKTLHLLLFAASKKCYVLRSFVLRWTVFFPCCHRRNAETSGLKKFEFVGVFPHLTPGPRGSLAMEPPKADACWSSASKEQRNNRKEGIWNGKPPEEATSLAQAKMYWYLRPTNSGSVFCDLVPETIFKSSNVNFRELPTLPQCLDCPNPPYQTSRIKTLPYEK